MAHLLCNVELTWNCTSVPHTPLRSRNHFTFACTWPLKAVHFRKRFEWLLIILKPTVITLERKLLGGGGDRGVLDLRIYGLPYGAVSL
jgi:hypothetical protein